MVNYIVQTKRSECNSTKELNYSHPDTAILSNQESLLSIPVLPFVKEKKKFFS